MLPSLTTRLTTLLVVCSVATAQEITIPFAVPQDAGSQIPAGFLGFSIEMAGFVDFSGTKSNPNKFTYNLMNSLSSFTGVSPNIRCGGTTQDEVWFDPSQSEPIVTVNPYSFIIGPSYWESFNLYPGGTKLTTPFSFGNQTSAFYQNLLAAASTVCKVIDRANVEFWELGNEPDLLPKGEKYSNIADYATAYKNSAKMISAAVAQACPEFSDVKFFGPSFSGPANGYNEGAAFAASLNGNGDIQMISSHNYIDGAPVAGVTLVHTLLNHTRTMQSVQSQTDLWSQISKYASGIPFVLGETNSLWGGGKSGLSNVFGAAMWGVDFALRCASQSIERIYFHQAAGAPYSAWYPLNNGGGSMTTLPPYYGNIATAAFLGKDAALQVVDYPQSETLSVYGAYASGSLTRIAVLNMNEWNSTESGSRPSTPVTISVPGTNASSATVKRLQAAGSDATTGVTFNGYSWDYNLGQGMPVNVHNLAPEIIQITGGAFTINMPDSEVAIIQF